MSRSRVFVHIYWLADTPASLAEPKLGRSAGSIARHEGEKNDE
jgi:hypothetical protein